MDDPRKPSSVFLPPSDNPQARVAGVAVPHDSAALHVSGAARYIDDIPMPGDTVFAAIGMSPIAHGHITRLCLDSVRSAPGVVAVLTEADLPGANNYGPILADDPLLTSDLVQFVGQPVFVVAARTCEQARRAVRLALIECAPLPAILEIREAIAKESFVIPTERLVRGFPVENLASAPRRLSGSLVIGGQDHFYLEGQVAAAIPDEGGAMLVYSSTQHPTEVQHLVAEALKRKSHEVTVQCRRMGGGFGGKESQPALFACLAAILAARLERAVKIRVDRDVDMVMTGKRHDFVADYDVGFDDAGRLCALSVMLASRCGYSADLSGPVNDRAMFHVDNAYFLEHVSIVSHRCKTHTVSNTAFRGFGGPQGMMVIEHIMDDIARHLGLDPLAVRRSNFYGVTTRNVTPYAMTVEDNVIERIVDELALEGRYLERRREIEEANRSSPVIKRGIALTPVKFGISFNSVLYNQAGALVHVYTDGTVLLNHGGTEMGQGLYTKVAQVVADEFGLPLERVRVSATDTSKVPNTSATAASSGSDLNGKAAQAAARTIRSRLVDFLVDRYNMPSEAIRFSAGWVHVGDVTLPFVQVVKDAYAARISLSSTGFYRTPKIHYDRKSMTGRPFFYFAYGAALAEVCIDTLTGENRLLQVDILHDAGRSINPAIDRGQIEGGFLQGMGWLTSEELWWNDRGELKTHAPSTYKIPTAYDWPRRSTVRLLANADNVEDTIFRSKAVGEPPLMLAIAVFRALAHAIDPDGPRAPALNAPATAETILKAFNRVREARLGGANP
ncbi:MAG: xanthine dehydrogenase molybdopterin binding subunit [Burkholderiaceae bacterium]|jgi:xanthine dehydrogenase large subunit